MRLSGCHSWPLVVLILLGCAAPIPADDETDGNAAEDHAALPGRDPYPDDLQRRLDAALDSRGGDYVARTHHLLEGGAPRFTNRLILESSPYLLQHAHNPVNWYPWGDEAFETARSLGRPILLSIGYSTCHWCHVMEEESFEDLEIAAYLNANYVAIKVDREERPDLDSIYMSAVQMLTGRGGWPMTSWLTPDRRPFFGGTYFPARDGDRGSRKGFLTLLRELKGMYDEQPDKVAQQAQQITARVRAGMVPAPGEESPGVELIDSALRQLAARFDGVHGGLNRAPKFPSSLPIRLLMRRHRATGDDKMLEMATLTLTRMAQGGMYDQVGGGFHRYSTDVRWLVPHFEKMLYDNALLAVAYLEGFQLTGNPDYSRVAREVLRYVGREMTAPGGAFYSATDADSPTPSGEREEGWFFTWTPQELKEVLQAQDAALFSAYYGVTEPGNFEGRSILHVARPLDEVVAAFELTEARAGASLRASRRRLYDERSSRPGPLRDDKILTAWNGLMISAFALGGFVLDEPDLVQRGERAASFVWRQLRVEGRLKRAYKDGRAHPDGFLDDYAFLIAGFLDLYEATSEIRWLERAIELQDLLDRDYRDDGSGGYFMTANDHEKLLAREKPLYDGAEPSGNSVAAMNLVRLHELTSDDRYRKEAERLFRGFGAAMRRRPNGLSEMLLALDFRASSPKELVIVTARGRRDAQLFLDVLRTNFLPNKVLAVVQQSEIPAQVDRLPLLEGKVARKKRATAYVCEQGVCQLPTTDPGVFAAQLGVGEESPGE